MIGQSVGSDASRLSCFLFRPRKSREKRRKRSYTNVSSTLSTRSSTPPAQTPHVRFHERTWVHTRLSEKDRTQGLTRRNRGCFGWGRYYYPRSVSHVHKHPQAWYQNGVLCRFWVLVGGTPKERREPRDSDALMRVAVPRRRGPAGLRNLFLLLSKLRLVHPALRTLCVYEVGVVSLPSVRFACSQNAGRPLVKAAHLPFSEVGWSSLISAAQNVLDRYSLLMIDFKYQKSIINRPTKKGGPHGRLQTGRC